MPSKVLITRIIPQPGLEILKKAGFNLCINELNRPLNRSELEREFKTADAAITMLTDRIDGKLIAAAQNLKIIANHAVGVDNIDIEACTTRRIAVTNTPGVLTEATADLTFALILGLSRRIVEGDRLMREQRFTGWDPLLLVGSDLKGKNLGIIGMGRIGRAVARRAQGFEMNVIYNNRNRLEGGIEKELNATYMKLDQLISEADFLTLHLPYYPEVHHLLGEEKLKLMKKNAYLINTARGAHIDEKRLLELLREKAIAGAALDVYENEPLVTEGLEDLDNVILLPHIGSATVKARNAMAIMAASSVKAILEGKRPDNLLNPIIYEYE